MDGLVEAVLEEARAERTRGRFERFGSLYLGGGTPSCLPVEALTRLVEGLRATWPLDADAEITLEVNPDDVDEGRAERWMALGFGRLSLGAQSFDDAALRWMGRRHDAAGADRAIRVLRAAGFADLGLDLIWGLPGGLDAGWDASLERALAHRPEHLSCYQLTVEPATPLGRRVGRGAVIPLDDDRLADRFDAVHARLADAGYEHYEVSSYARSPGTRSRHNTRYWRHAPYLGLGPAAHSFDGGRTRWWNPRSLATYRAMLRGSAPPPASEQLDDDALTTERVMLAVRTAEGLPRDLAPCDDGTCDALRREGLLTLRGGVLRPTVRGLRMADHVALRLLD